MPYRRDDSPIWWASFTDAKGRRVRRSTGTTDRREADALEAKWKLEAHQAQMWGAEVTHTFEELMTDYLKARQGEINLEPVIMSIKRLRPMFAGRDMGKVKRADISAFILKRKGDGVAPATINRDLDTLSAAINYAARRWDWDIPNPVAGMSLKLPQGRLRWLKRAEVEKLIQLAEQEPKAPHLGDFIRLAVNTGCRRGELLGLEWDRVDFQAGSIRLEVTKSGSRRFVPMTGEARLALEGRARFRAEFCPGSPWVFSHKNGERIREVRHGFVSLCRRAGIEDFRIHDLRHTCASWLVSNGVPLRVVQEMLGHASIQMTERYAHLAPENLKAVVHVLDQMSRSGHAGGLEPSRCTA